MTAPTPDPTAGEGTPRPWPENAWPTIAELADWLSRCTSRERLEYAARSLTTAQQAAACIDHDHEARIARESAAAIRARAEAWDEGYQRGLRDAEQDVQHGADNPYAPDAAGESA